MKKHEMEQEKKRIYQDWLNGVRIEDLARKYHHWRCVIVMILREQARASASVHNQQVTAGQQATKCLRQEWEPPEEIKKNIILLSLAVNGASEPESVRHYERRAEDGTERAGYTPRAVATGLPPSSLERWKDANPKALCHRSGGIRTAASAASYRCRTRPAWLLIFRESE